MVNLFCYNGNDCKKIEVVRLKNEKETRSKKRKPQSSLEKVTRGSIISIEVIQSALYFLFALLFLGGSLGLGIGLGYFADLVKETPIPSKKELVRAINDIELVSKINYADGSKIAELRSDIVRTKVASDKIAPVIKQALIATEDEYFEKHKGIVPKALARATISELTGLGGQSGGSTITQQLVKQQLLTNEVSFSRKAKEIMYALKVEQTLSKDDILVAYLNVSPFGRNNKGQNIAGVQEAARGIFGVSAEKVNLPQAAFIAGLPQSPIVYSPYTNTGEIKEDLTYGLERKDAVLANMYREQLISKAEYEEAKQYDLAKDFLKQDTADETQKGYLYYYVENQAIETLMLQYIKKDELKKDEVFNDKKLYEKYYTLAERDIRHNGYTIQTTINKDIYAAMNNAVQNNAWLINDWSGNTIQNGSVLMENKTGKILGFVGGLNYNDNQNNHAFTTRRSPGSTMKPVVAYAPAVDIGLIGTETQMADFKRDYRGTNKEITNYGGKSSESFISVREALKTSGNITVVNLYEELRNHTNPEDYFKKMNMNMPSEDFSNDSLPLGTNDLSVYEQTNAYQTLANNGAYIEGYVIQTIKDADGKVVYEHDIKPVQVFQKATASIMNNLMRDVLSASGTGYTAKTTLSAYSGAASGDWVGKTGTSEEDRDFWFIASTPGVTLSSWIGKSDNKSMPHTFGQNNMKLWATIASAAYQVAPETFDIYEKFTLDPSVQAASVSSETGTTIGSFTYEGRNYYTPGSSVTSYYTSTSAIDSPHYQFGIGGTTENYQAFWNRKVKKETSKKTTTNKPDEKNENKDDDTTSDDKKDE